jgi:uncharacterized protein YndB with AHSA1/START domain
MHSEKKFEHKGRVIRAEISTNATPEQAWEAWADPKKIAQWFVDRASGEAKPGGVMTWFFDDFGFKLPYQVLEAKAGQSLLLKWNPPQGPSVIHEVRIERQGGKTVVRLIESGFQQGAEWDEQYEGVDSGWKSALRILGHYVENYFGRNRKVALLVRPASFEYSDIRPYFFQADKLAMWLTRSGAMGNEGELSELELWDGGRLTGEVLAVTKRELAASWHQMEGALEMKAFSMGPQRMLGVRLMSWKNEENSFKRARRALNQAVERLAAQFPAETSGTVRAKSPSEA